MIAFDAATNGGIVNPGTSLTWSHTCGGSDRLLIASAFGDVSTDVITGATYASVAMTQLGKIQISGDRWVHLFYKLNPASGANDVVVSASSSIVIAGNSASYTGVSALDANATNSQTSTATYNTSLTTTVDNCWVIMVVKTSGGASNAPEAGTATTRRVENNDIAIMDSNAVVSPAGSRTLQATAAGTPPNWASIIGSFTPTVGGTTYPGYYGSAGWF